MRDKAASLKGRIKNYAKEKNITAQVVLQNYMVERFLERLSVSDYSQRFIIKGGVLISAIVGLENRSTMDLDATLCNVPLTEEKVVEMIERVCKIRLPDGVRFEIKTVRQIRKEDLYGGYEIRLDAQYDTIVTPLSIDISTGDVITPAAVQYVFKGLFDERMQIRLWGYNIETMMAEKVETILRRNVFNTRPRDFYDVYVLATREQYDAEVFEKALHATAMHRGSVRFIEKAGSILRELSESGDMKQTWEQYRRRFPYAGQIEYSQVIEEIRSLQLIRGE